MKKLAIIIFGGILLTSLHVSAQDEPQFSQYMAAPVLFNPGAAGMGEAWNSSLFIRSQWVDLPGAPQTQSLVSELPVYRINSGLSIGIWNDQAGQQKTTQAHLGYSWLKTFKHSTLGIGAYGGIANRALDGTKLISPNGSYENIIDHQDNYIPNTLESDLIPDAGAGVFWASDRFKAGVSVTHLLANYFRFQTPAGNASVQYQPTGYVFLSCKVLNTDLFSMEPNVLIKSDLTEHMADLNLLFRFKDNLLAGASFRTFTGAQTDALVVMGGWNFSRNWGIRYSYDINLSPLNNVNAGSHEVLLTYMYPVQRPRAGKEINNLRYLYY